MKQRNIQYPPDAVVAWEKHRSLLNKAKMARDLNIPFTTICSWRAVPKKFVPVISELTSIPKSALRPDLYKGDN